MNAQVAVLSDADQAASATACERAVQAAWTTLLLDLLATVGREFTAATLVTGGSEIRNALEQAGCRNANSASVVASWLSRTDVQGYAILRRKEGAKTLWRVERTRARQ